MNSLVLITTGDSDGVGLEITLKALGTLGPKLGTTFIVLREANTAFSDQLEKLSHRFEGKTVSSIEEALDVSNNSRFSLIDIASNRNPVEWVEEGAKLGIARKIDALVTAPLSKTLISHLGRKDKGHTDILKRVSGIEDLYMCFLGDRFHVSLVTDHIPLSSVAEKFNFQKLKRCLELSHEVLDQLQSHSESSIGVLGLNPHAGEQGLLGREELDQISPLIESQPLLKGRTVLGPLVPDVAFQEPFRKRVALYVAMYHDQGLIPFKSLNSPHSGTQLTLGLPFIRTSVDHGTAKDIYGKDLANHNSMQEAINWALKLKPKK